MATKSNTDIMTMMEEWFAQAPALPANIRETLVKITPILALVFGILGVIGALSGLGLMTALTPAAMMGGAPVMHNYGMGFIAALGWLASSALMLAAYPGTKARKIKGWEMLFWSEVVSFVSSIVSLSILSGIISAVIGFYLLYQIKSYYK